MLLTIFTPTYNRAHTLPRLFHSLTEQNRDNFEWIIIDDDSDDNTEEVIEGFITEKFPLIYKKQEHGGKHRAINRALELARGDFFFIVDSDDMLTTDATERIEEWIKGLPDSIRFCGVSGMRVDHNGQIVGRNSAAKGMYVDATNLERKKYDLLGDKAEVYDTKILRKHPFPEFEGEFFLTESLVWDSIASEGYKIRWYNVPIYICEYLPDGLSNSGANSISGSSKNFKGYTAYIKQYLRLHSKKENYGKFTEYNKVCKTKGIRVTKRGSYIEMSKMQFMKMYLYSVNYRILKRILRLEK